MLDHISIPVRDFAKATKFYDAVLATIGLKRTKEREGAIGYGSAVGLPPEFWILEQNEPSAARSGVGLHVSFRVKSRTEVHAFHAEALAQDGTDAGPPGVRPHYTAGFYGAFVCDLEGFKIEAVVREALPSAATS